MAIAQICIKEIDEYRFMIWDTTTQQMYDNAGIDLSSDVTAAYLDFIDLKTNTKYTINILPSWEYFLGEGITVNILDFPDNTMGDYEFFPDWSYTATVRYTYSGVEYSTRKSVGFRAKISNIVYQQLQQSDWAKEIKCGCGCEKYSTTFRKFDYLNGLEIASDNCLLAQYTDILLALYKLSGITHEYSN